MAAQSILIRDLPLSVREWIARECADRSISQQDFMLQLLERAATGGQQADLFKTSERPAVHNSVQGMPFGFVDLFAGIGGMRLGLERAGGRCLFTSEWDRYCQKTYKAWFGEEPVGDITKIEPADIPDHDVLAAGFPCQPFSIAGVSKKKSLGRAHGFDDAAQGNLFFNLAAIIDAKRPPAILLENVKNLQSHDKGRTWGVIRTKLSKLGYRIFTRIIDAQSWVPQHRERIFVVGFDARVFGDNPPFTFPDDPPSSPKLRSILEPSPDPKYTLSNHLWRYLREYADRHREKGNGFGYGIAPQEGVTRTLSARYYKDGSEILISQEGKRNPRRLTPREAARLMGFPDSLPIVVSDTQAYKQFGNAVVPDVVASVARRLAGVLEWHLKQTRGGCIVKLRPSAFAEHLSGHADAVASM